MSDVTRLAGTQIHLLICLTLGASQTALAVESRKIEEVLVTGTRLSQSTSHATIHVVDEDLLNSHSPTSVLDALQLVPGVYVSEPGGRGGVASVSLRGSESNFVVVLVDGVQVNDPNNTRGGSFDFNTIDINEVHRIEIAHGAATAVYGSDALSGVISITTHASNETGTQIGVRSGEDNFFHAGLRSALSSATLGDLQVSFSSTQDDSKASGSQFEAANARANYSKQWHNQLLAMRLSAARSEQQGFPEDSGGIQFSVLRELDERVSESFSASFEHRIAFSDTLRLQSDLTYYDKTEDFDSPGISGGPRNPFGVPRNTSNSELKRARFSSFVSGHTERADWAAGVQWQTEKGTSDGNVDFVGPSFFELDRDTTSAFAEALVSPTENFTVSTGVRIDKADTYDHESTYRLSAQYAVSPSMSIYARHASGFKLPSFFALGNSLVGNPDLLPERVVSSELGWQVDFAEQHKFEVAAFHSSYEDLIDFDPVNFTNVNRSDVSNTGFDFNVAGNMLSSRLGYQFFFSYVDIQLEGAGQFRQRPKWRTGGAVQFKLSNRIDLSLGVQRNDRRFDSSIPNPSVTLGRYTRVDVAAHWQPSEKIRFSATIDNVTDEDYFYADGFNAAGVLARLGFKLFL